MAGFERRANNENDKPLHVPLRPGHHIQRIWEIRHRLLSRARSEFLRLHSEWTPSRRSVMRTVTLPYTALCAVPVCALECRVNACNRHDHTAFATTPCCFAAAAAYSVARRGQVDEGGGIDDLDADDGFDVTRMRVVV